MSENQIDDDSISEDKNNVVQEIAPHQSEDKIDLTEIASEFDVKAAEPRGLLASLVITFLFTFGPIALALDLVIPKMFASISFNITMIFGGLTGLFVLLAIIKAILDR